MTKEPNKDFRQAVREVLVDACLETEMFIRNNGGTHQTDEHEWTVAPMVDRILALCKEMLVHDVWKEYPNNEEFYREHMTAKVHNSARQHLLKQLGEK